MFKRWHRERLLAKSIGKNKGSRGCYSTHSLVDKHSCLQFQWNCIILINNGNSIALHIELAHEIMALFVLSKLILQTCMRSHPVGLDVWFLVGPFVYFHTSCVRTAKALVRLRECAGSPEPSLVAYVVSTIISWAGSINISKKEKMQCWTKEDHLRLLEWLLTINTLIGQFSANSQVKRTRRQNTSRNLGLKEMRSQNVHALAHLQSRTMHRSVLIDKQ